MNARLAVLVSCGIGSFLTLPALAALISVPATDTGFYNEAGRSSKNDGTALGIFSAPGATFNYSAGAIDEVPPLSGTDVPRKNYFTFDLSGVSETIVGATVEAFLPPGGFASPTGSETFSFYGSILPGPGAMDAFATPLFSVFPILGPDSLETAKDLYAKLGDSKGVFAPLATVTLTAVDAGTMVAMEMTPTGLSYLNLHKGGLVVLSGQLDSLDGVDAGEEFVFGFSSPLYPGIVSPDPVFSPVTPSPALVLTTVPEPGAMMAVAGLALAGWWTQRRRGS